MSASAEQQQHAVERASRIFEIVRDAANNGHTCPSNATLAERFGVGTARIVNALHFLEKCGMIIVDRANSSRVVTIRSSGKQTAGKIGKPHWTKRNG